MPYVQYDEENKIVGIFANQQTDEDGNSLDLEWVDGEVELEPTLSIQEQINALESLIDNRRLREAILTEEGKDWLQEKHDAIEALRSQL
jgi:hypothetical protein